MRRTAAIATALLLLAGGAAAQPVSAAFHDAAIRDSDLRWHLSASGYVYVVPDDTTYVQPTVTADRGRLHLEARYNYEDRDTGSAWVGCTLRGGERLEWELTPMIGAIAGSTAGAAPGFRGSLDWRRLGLYSEGEYVVAPSAEDRFVYNWSEATIAPTDWFRFGLVTQRTRAYETERDIQRGLLVGFTFGRSEVTGHVFNPDDAEPTVVVSVRVALAGR